MIKRKIEAEAAGISKKKKDQERDKKTQKAEWPGGIEPALARHLGAGLYGPELSGHSDCSKLKLA